MKAHIHRQCLNWLDKWLTQFKEHIRSLAGKINRARSGQVVRYSLLIVFIVAIEHFLSDAIIYHRGTKNPKTPPQVKGILKGREVNFEDSH